MPKADRSRTDAFQCQCLRQVLRIAPSFISRVSNDVVLDRAGQTRLSSLLERRQVELYHKIETLAPDSFLKRLVCDSNGQPLQWSRQRGRGRPRQLWVRSVFNLYHNHV